MPLRDHFHPPRHWEGIHGAWATTIASALNRVLPPRYVAEPGVHRGASVEVDVGFFDREGGEDAGGIATATWAPPTLAVETDLPGQDVFEVLVRDEAEGRLVAVVELVSPANNDRPASRRAFVAKVTALIQDRVSVVVVDVVTSRRADLFATILREIGPEKSGPGLDTAIYAAAVRPVKRDGRWTVEAWEYPLAVGLPLPTVPLWLAENLVCPLDLEATHEETCRNLRIR